MTFLRDFGADLLKNPGPRSGKPQPADEPARTRRVSGTGERAAALAPLLLRLFVAFVLVYGTQDNVFHRERMLEFRDFLAANGFPYPLQGAYVSAWAQFTTGILLALGLWTRAAAAIVVVNFVVALFVVHVGLPFNANIAPLAMLTGGLFFLLRGAPEHSLEARRANREALSRSGR
jgi:putative oxidoreductase